MSASIALYTDPLTTVLSDGVTKRISTSGTGTWISFEGDRKPRGFRGVSIADRWDLVCVFGPANFAGAQELLDMLELAFESADARLMLYPGGKDLSTLWVVEVLSWNRDIVPVGAITQVAFTAQEVRG